MLLFNISLYFNSIFLNSGVTEHLCVYCPLGVVSVTFFSLLIAYFPIGLFILFTLVCRNSSCILDCNTILVSICISKIYPNFGLLFKFLNNAFVRCRFSIFISLNLTICSYGRCFQRYEKIWLHFLLHILRFYLYMNLNPPEIIFFIVWSRKIFFFPLIPCIPEPFLQLTNNCYTSSSLYRFLAISGLLILSPWSIYPSLC